MILRSGLAHFQNGELSDEFAENLDVCLAKDTQAADEGTSSVLLAISKNNVYDGRIGKGYPTDLKRKFLAIRKKNSEEVRTHKHAFLFNSHLNLNFIFS